jgi:hypothetical protein
VTLWDSKVSTFWRNHFLREFKDGSGRFLMLSNHITWHKMSEYSYLSENKLLYKYIHIYFFTFTVIHTCKKGESKIVLLQAWSGPEGSRKLRFPDYMTTAQDGGKVVSCTHRLPLPPGNAPRTHFCQRLSRPQGHSAIGRIMSMKNSIDTIWN